MTDLRNQFEGALLGCAVGDALGAPYEGYWARDIPGQEMLLGGFGDFDGYPLGQYTDDTQLTLATAKAVVAERSISPAAIAREIGELWRHATVIGPGGACMEAGDKYLRSGDWRTCGAPPGRAGNGTAMRTVFLGLFFRNNPQQLAKVVSDVCRVTHLDPRSVAGGVAVAQLAHSLATQPEAPYSQHLVSIHDAMASIHIEFAKAVLELHGLIGTERDEVASRLAWSNDAELPLDQPIITPFIIPTVLASIWSVLTYPASWGDAVYHAIALGGDVDTLGAIVGALIGVKLGADAIPAHLVRTVQDADMIRALARQLASLHI